MLETLIPKSWDKYLRSEFQEPYFQKLSKTIEQAYESEIVYPKSSEIFNAFNTNSPEQIKVVILGQDPYHGEGQAHGLSFSVKKGVRLPPSLKNIYKEIESSLSIKMPEHGDLSHWANQGVFLLNTSLTVEAGKAGSHSKLGWQKLTDRVIQIISKKKNNVVFLLWGGPAIKKAQLIDEKRHLILTAPHPSPLSAYRGFLGCGHFVKANEYLKNAGKTEVDWAGLG